MTAQRGSRKDACIRSGANTKTSWILGLLALATACDTSRDAAELEIPIALVDRKVPVDRVVPKAKLTRIDVYGAAREEAVGSRVVLVFEGAPLFKQERLPASEVLPARIAIELLDTEWTETLPALTTYGHGGVEHVRLAKPGPRVVVDLQPGARGRVFYLTDPYRIVIDVDTNTSVHKEEGRAVIVLDPGHGGDEPGAANSAFDLVESQLALEIAILTRERLREIMPRAQVLLTREDDSPLSLAARCALANAMGADVFVSIHLNAATEEVRRGGVTTFILDATNDRQALRLAARENGTRVAEVSGLQKLLARLHRRGQIDDARRLASHIQRSTLKEGRRILPRLSDRGVRQSMFYVLVGASMPAVLVEASFLTYEPEARALATRHYRRRLADGIAQGIASYLEAR